MKKQVPAAEIAVVYISLFLLCVLTVYFVIVL
jgi:hypothetical protein